MTPAEARKLAEEMRKNIHKLKTEPYTCFPGDCGGGLYGDDDVLGIANALIAALDRIEELEKQVREWKEVGYLWQQAHLNPYLEKRNQCWDELHRRFACLLREKP